GKNGRQMMPASSNSSAAASPALASNQRRRHGGISIAVIVNWPPCQFTLVASFENDADELATKGASASAASAAVWKRSAGSTRRGVAGQHGSSGCRGR